VNGLYELDEGLQIIEKELHRFPKFSDYREYWRKQYTEEDEWSRMERFLENSRSIDEYVELMSMMGYGMLGIAYKQVTGQELSVSREEITLADIDKIKKSARERGKDYVPSYTPRWPIDMAVKKGGPKQHFFVELHPHGCPPGSGKVQINVPWSVYLCYDRDAERLIAELVKKFILPNISPVRSEKAT